MGDIVNLRQLPKAGHEAATTMNAPPPTGSLHGRTKAQRVLGSSAHTEKLHRDFDAHKIETGETPMKSPVVKRSIVIAGHKTSVSLEDAFWSEPQGYRGHRAT